MGRTRETFAAVTIGAVVCSTAGCTSSSPGPGASDASLTTSDGASAEGPSDAAVATSDAPAAACSVAPYPNGLACDDPAKACLPEAGFDCCRCLPTTNCRYPTQWVCEGSDSHCPAEPPGVGSQCSLPQSATCVYCTQPAVVVACANGTWQPVADHAYCEVTD